MIKVVIIDDEPIIVEGLTKSVPWEKYGCIVIGSAGNGIEGRKLIMEKKPDIVFLDISMPQMDGLSMVAGLKSEYTDMQVTVLTGFRDFEYAKKALNLGVVRFLLKPSNMDEIEEAIEFMVSRINEKEQSYKSYGVADSEADTKFISAEETEKATTNFIVRNALSYIEEHYNEKLMLADVADKVYVSQWHLSKLLNKELSQNFSEVLNGVRIKKAKELLADPSKSISEVSDEVGFLEVAHFSKVFKKLTGESANEFRNKLETK